MIYPVVLLHGTDSLCNCFLGVTNRVLCVVPQILDVCRRFLRGAAFTIILLSVLTFDRQLPTLVTCIGTVRYCSMNSNGSQLMEKYLLHRSTFPSIN
jgi:hypothetical protein